MTENTVDKQVTSKPEDKYLWLEEIEGERAISWVKECNAQSTEEIQAHSSHEAIHGEVRDILFAKDRVPFASFEHGHCYNFWEDDAYKHGLLRRCSLEEYKKDSPAWQVLLDLDALSLAENENWVYSGRQWLDRDSSRGLLSLSRGGKDAVEVREFDFAQGCFLHDKEDGFFVAEAKTNISPIDEHWLFIGSDFGEGSLTESGYPRQARLWRRGQPLSEARLLFNAKASDLTACADMVRDGKEKHVIVYRMIDFFHCELFYYTSVPAARESEKVFPLPENAEELPELRLLPIPETAEFLNIVDRLVYIRLKEPLSLSLSDRVFPTNAILRFPLSATSLVDAETVFAAEEGQSIERVSVWRDRVFVTLLDDVRSKILCVSRCATAAAWKTCVLPLPSTGMLTLSLREEDDPQGQTLLTFTDHLTPSTQYLLREKRTAAENASSSDDASDDEFLFELELLKQSPHRFDASAFVSSQHFATSKDGTRVPYFLLHSKDLSLTGENPTILYGYGGFEVSLTPHYSSLVGKVWLQRGGVYAIANIRGGGEFGPQWHQAALKTKRQCAYDDFAAVAEDLIARKVTSPRHLGISGGSNGGLLVSVLLTQRPELFNAVLCQVPLADMARFHLLLAGASWIGEYGDPEDEEELAFLLKISPYHNVRSAKEVQYPNVLVTTSTKDDRVHPAHARKLVARLREAGHPLLYFENINGGHAGSANLDEDAMMKALEYTYFWKELS